MTGTCTRSPDQAHELLPSVYGPLDDLPHLPTYVVCNRGYASRKFRKFLWNRWISSSHFAKEKRSSSCLSQMGLQTLVLVRKPVGMAQRGAGCRNPIRESRRIFLFRRFHRGYSRPHRDIAGPSISEAEY